jgi:Tfp pilus assembly protein PilN
MIEINLLPEEYRQVEGTPAARLITILVGIAAACVLGILVFKFYFMDIPQMKTEIANRETEIKALTEQKKTVEGIIAQIDTLKLKVKTLDDLIQGRIRYGRLLDTLANAMPAEGVWFRSFSIQPLNSTARAGFGSSAGKQFQINLQGFTQAPTEKERRDRLTDLYNNIENAFLVKDVDPKTKINKFMGLKFDAPRVVGFSEVTSVPEFKDADPKILQALQPQITKQGLDFSMTLTFELPALEHN